MHVPPMYRADDEDRARQVVHDYPLATLVSNGPRVPHATHLPVVAAPGAPQVGGLAGSTLWGHLNRANAHWRALAGGVPAVLVFTGPHAYITPAIYRTTPAVPTWDFVSVHLHGRVEPIDGEAGTLEVVKRTAELFESAFGAGWAAEPSHGHFARIVSGVGAFRFHVESVDSMFKLSQEKDRDVRVRIIASLREASGPAAELGRIMHEHGLGGRGAEGA
ncbi:FMN-binding negative transcriptional regulator [Actinosynnema pretiosum subsp. pretiosum]|uniref:FMN-binding negative transcriptional regulator n=2 Tax=Actinosynnema TaxID=40566 RepID=C6WLE0_ACTMD|nr:FMN-binding negative transcriptional regulator [Actinosynnema mirum]ACU38333.1 FMN-binding negative transcriptional regulator [Actinosynnema mirum DSM 43827]AXX31857.1 Transcriptional regulator [Actinosynnema pretiosum subsp. pretiosum]QUF04157.1 FMN-binding negative transcriptional regulator [Actinosynnema pretiosum subsp. pretiosum]